MIIRSLTILLLIGCSHQLLAEDVRIKIDFPAPARDHMMSSMRDHLMAIESITRKLSRQQFVTCHSGYRVH